MVHLSTIQDKPETGNQKAQQAHAEARPTEDDAFTSSVYGSKFAGLDLPKQEMPEGEMPKEVAYRMIKDELSLDGNPMLNLASFVTTYMVRLIHL